MNRTEFDELGKYVAGLWPKWVLTPEQREAWYWRLQYSDIYTARQAIGAAYADCVWKEPTLAAVMSAIKNLKRANSGSERTDFSSAYISQVQREEAEEAALLATWTDEERENGRQEIMIRESGMKMLLATCPLRSSMLTHFLVERYVLGRTIIFPNGRPEEITREERWAITPGLAPL